MALIAKGVEFSKTIDGLIFYPLNGNTYVRAKGTLTKKRVLKDKAFEKTRKCASDMGRAAKIGSVIYKALPANIRERWLYQAITGEAASLLYSGKEDQQVKELLWKKYIQDTGVEEEAKEIVPLNMNIKTKYRNLVDSSKASNIQLCKIFAERWEKQGMPPSRFKRAWQKRGYFVRERFREVLDHIDRPKNKKFRNLKSTLSILSSKQAKPARSGSSR